MVDATQSLSSTDFTRISRLRTLDATLAIAANRPNVLPIDQVKPTLTALQERTSRPVIPVVANQPLSVQGHFIPAYQRWCAEVSYALAGEVKPLRRRVLVYLIVRSELTGRMATVQTDGLGDSPVLAHVQM